MHFDLILLKTEKVTKQNMCKSKHNIEEGDGIVKKEENWNTRYVYAIANEILNY